MHFTRSPLAILHAAIAIVVLALYSNDKALAQADVAANYPAKLIRLIVGFAAGGANDLLARIVSQKLAENIGQPVVVENKPGAGGRLAVEYAQGQPGDGYTMIVGATGQLAISSAIYPNLPFHPTRTLIPLTMIASYPLIIAGAMKSARRAAERRIEPIDVGLNVGTTALVYDLPPQRTPRCKHVILQVLENRGV